MAQLEGAALEDVSEMLKVTAADHLKFVIQLDRSDGYSSGSVGGLSDFKTTKLGTGRFWVLDVVYENQNGELVGTESYTAFGYRRKS